MRLPASASTVQYSVAFSSAEAATLNQAADYFGIPRANTLAFGAQVMRFLDLVSGGFGPVPAAPTSSGPMTLTATYTNPDDVAAIRDLARRMGISVPELHLFGARVLEYIWYFQTH